MQVTFLEATNFTKSVYEYFGSDVEFAEFQTALLVDPDRGDVMRGCGGLRKVRWRDPRRGKGARGGLRIIYLHVPEANRIFLLYVYDKDESEDLTSGERQSLAALAQSYREEARKVSVRKEH